MYKTFFKNKTVFAVLILFFYSQSILPGFWPFDYFCSFFSETKQPTNQTNQSKLNPTQKPPTRLLPPTPEKQPMPKKTVRTDEDDPTHTYPVDEYCQGTYNYLDHLRICRLFAQMIQAKKLCSHCIKAYRASTEKLYAKKLCSECAKLMKLQTEKIQSTHIETGSLDAQKIDAESIKTSNLCAHCLELLKLKSYELVSQKICAHNAYMHKICTHDLNVGNDLAVNGKIVHCTPYKAKLFLSDRATYTLGDDIPFESVHDPNGNTILPGYIAPTNGWYIVSLHTSLFALHAAHPITGTPVVCLEYKINGQRESKSFEPFLTFGPDQQNSFTCLIQLAKNDHLTAALRIFALDGTGKIDVRGEVTLLGHIHGKETHLDIHYLSSVCPPFPSEPCPELCQIEQPCLACSYHDQIMPQGDPIVCDDEPCDCENGSCTTSICTCLNNQCSCADNPENCICPEECPCQQVNNTTEHDETIDEFHEHHA